jgi:hypothetical protein
MSRTTIALSLLALIPLAWKQERRRPIVPLDEGTMILEHVVGGEAVVRIEAESEEELEHVRVLGPDGAAFLELGTRRGAELGLSGLVLELRETSLEALLASHAEGDYDIRATTVGGNLAVGKARLSFDLPAAPRVVYPPPGAFVPSSGLTVTWLADRSAAGYHVQLEQGESDGLAVKLPPGRNSFRVPDGFLARGTETLLEITALGPGGNRTVVEIAFTTLP